MRISDWSSDVCSSDLDSPGWRFASESAGPLDTIATRSLGVNGERGRSLGVNREKGRSLGSLDTRSFCPRNRNERVSRLCRPHSPHPLMPRATKGGVSRNGLTSTPSTIDKIDTRTHRENRKKTCTTEVNREK